MTTPLDQAVVRLREWTATDWDCVSARRADIALVLAALSRAERERNELGARLELLLAAEAKT